MNTLKLTVVLPGTDAVSSVTVVGAAEQKNAAVKRDCVRRAEFARSGGTNNDARRLRLSVSACLVAPNMMF